MSSRIEGIGRPASVAAAQHTSVVLGRRVGPSTGTNLWGAFGLLAEMFAHGRSGSVVTLIADSGDRYADTYFSDEWLTSQGLDPSAFADGLVEFERSGRWS
jgi:cysteine synthase A